MITNIAVHLMKEDIFDLIIKTRITDDGERYWVIKLAPHVSIFIEDDADFRMLSDKISNALEEGGRQSESATYQCSVGVPGSPVSGEGSSGSTG